MITLRKFHSIMQTNTISNRDDSDRYQEYHDVIFYIQRC